MGVHAEVHEGQGQAPGSLRNYLTPTGAWRERVGEPGTLPVLHLSHHRLGVHHRWVGAPPGRVPSSYSTPLPKPPLALQRSLVGSLPAVTAMKMLGLWTLVPC